MRTTSELRGIAALALLLAVALPASAAKPCRVDGRYVMGTVLELELCGGAPPSSFQHAFASAERLDALITTWTEDSALLRLNRAAGGPATHVPAPLHRALTEAIELSRTTNGAFDVSVGPLVEIWREAGRQHTAPAEERLSRVRTRVGSERLELSPDGSVRIPHGMSVDLGGFAKGIALDQIAADLRRTGVQSALLNFGQSSLFAIGAPPDGEAWNLWVRRPDGAKVGVVSLVDRAASVSATFGRTITIDGHRYSHVIDPRTGRPVPEERLAFVVARDASLAEALSTALIVLGPPGLAIAERLRDVEALVVEGDAGTLARTSGFDRETGFREY